MNVLQPGMLWLLGAMAIPIIIHLYNRKRAVRRKFPPIAFLLASNRKLARKLKVRQLILLAIRCAIFGLVPLAIARPYMLSDEADARADELPTAVVYLLDDSASMRQQAGGGGTSWERAVTRALGHVDSLRDELDVAGVVLASRPDDPPVYELTDDLSAVRSAIESADATWERVDLRRGLEVARDIAASSELPARRVVLITDRARGSWPEPLGEDLFRGVATVNLLELDARDGPNLALVDADATRDPSGAARTWQIRGEIRAFGLDEARDVTVQLRVQDSPVASVDATVDPVEGGEVSFTHQLPSTDPARVTLELQDGGILPADDVRHLMLAGSRNVRVLLVNGDPRNQPWLDELFYVEKALKPGPESRSTIVPRVTTSEALDPQDLEGIDVVFLHNVPALEPAQIAALEGFTRDGGGIFMTVGERVDPTVYNRQLGELLPKPLRSEKRLADLDDPDAAIKVTRIDRVDYTHAVMRPLAMPGGESIQRAFVYAYMLLEPQAGGEARIVASYADGGPALVERSIGAGRVMLLTTTIDRDWTNLPLNKTYLPTIQRIAAYLAKRSTEGEGSLATVGEPHAIPLEGYEPEALQVLDIDDDVVATFGKTDLAVNPTPTVRVDTPGHYRVRITEHGVESEVESLAFAANIAPEEANTERIDTDVLSQLWEHDEDAAEGDDTLVGAGADTPQNKRPLWPALLLAALILLYLETLVGLRRRFLKKLLPGRSRSEAEEMTSVVQ